MTDSYDIKSAQLSLMSLVAKTVDLQHVAADVLKGYGPGSDGANFFENDGVIIDTSRAVPGISSAGLKALIKALKQCHLLPVAFRGGSIADEAVAQALGLVLAPPEIAHVKPATPPSPPAVAAAEPVEIIREVVREVIREVVVQAPGPSTLIIEKPVRSGQKIYARGADLVVLAMVNQGGEVVADGHIHVYAPLRGKAMAGASGNTQARIFSTCLEPELISIAGVYRTSEHPLAPDIQGRAAQVRLSDDGLEKLLFETLAS